MAEKVIMPKLGLTMKEGMITEWLKEEGDIVKAGDVLYEMTTDKLTNEVEAKSDGVLRKILVQADETVPCLATVAVIGTADEDISELLA